MWSLATLRFTGDQGTVSGAEVEEVEWIQQNSRMVMKPIPGTARTIETDLVLLALGFVHPVLDGLISELEVELDARKNVITNDNFSTNIPGIFAAGDTTTGASLVVNAIASGRKAAFSIDSFLRS